MQLTPMPNEYHSQLTITLYELVQDGIFSWDRPELAGCCSAFGDFAEHVQGCVVDAYLWHEISVIPPRKWMQRLGYAMRHEIAPKYAPLYAALASGDLQLVADENEYFKRRKVESDYPETLITGNADYASAGADEEWQRVKVGNAADVLIRWRDEVSSIDAMIVCDLKKLFVTIWRFDANGW